MPVKEELPIIFSLLIIFIAILLAIIFALEIFNNIEREKNVRTCNGPVNVNVPMIYNNSSNNYEIILGPIKDEDGYPLNDANVTIEVNNCIFYNITNPEGYTTIYIPATNLPKNISNIWVKVILNAEGYEEIKFDANLIYP